MTVSFPPESMRTGTLILSLKAALSASWLMRPPSLICSSRMSRAMLARNETTASEVPSGVFRRARSRPYSRLEPLVSNLSMRVAYRGIRGLPDGRLNPRCVDDRIKPVTGISDSAASDVATKPPMEWPITTTSCSLRDRINALTAAK